MRKPTTLERGAERQRARREATADTQRAALAFIRWASPSVGRERVCHLLGVRRRTLASWAQRRRTGALTKSRGRPARRASAADKLLVEQLCQEHGPCLGSRQVCAALPGVARREVASLLGHYRRDHLDRDALVYVLRWLVPGHVWAMDFTEPPNAIDGEYPYLLMVRDLGSGNQLCALPVHSPDSEAVRACLVALFAHHGAPLVLKSDNGSCFVVLADWLDEQGVQLLLSPVRCPAYNGSCEAGIGAIKTRAHHVAAHRGRVEAWTSDDIESARRMANAAPRNAAGLCADQIWHQRSAVTDGERRAFRASLASLRDATTGELSRTSIQQAMDVAGLLTIRRRRITLPINPGFRARIS
jgi:hypothetical protein